MRRAMGGRFVIALQHRHARRDAGPRRCRSDGKGAP